MDHGRKGALSSDALDAWRDFLRRCPAASEDDFADLCARQPGLREALVELRAAMVRSTSGAAQERGSPLARLQALARPIERGARFLKESVLARGGMGIVHRARDLELNRTLAVKEMAAAPASAHALASARFLEEAQITAQLDHPGIVPVHELGVDAEGRLYYAMKLVEGRDLRAIFELVQEGREGWTQTRALGVLHKVCEAMAYAHSKGVIHRDLKPGNVMVGSFGEVYVMDWGLARALGRRDVHDLRLKLECEAESVRTERREEREETPDSPLVTMDGVVVGTPAYMPPEQARGEVHLLSPRSDVYAIGAMLYQLLTGEMPFVRKGTRPSKHTVLARVVDGPPLAVATLNPAASPELVAICEKAMARDPERRYADTLALGEELRAYLEHRVVHAHRSGALVELSKWVRRNRALAAAVATAALALIWGLVTTFTLYLEARENERLASAHEQQARDQALDANRRAEEVVRLSALWKLRYLVSEAERLWPVTPELVERYAAWLAEAEQLTRQVRSYEALLAGAAAPAQADGFASEEEEIWSRERLPRLIEEVEAFADERHGLFSKGVSPEHGWGVGRRYELARTLDERSVSGAEARARWEDARASIRDAAQCPAYAGLELAPQIGLLPIGRDPRSGLWEFAHLLSGAPAERGADGELVLDEDSGLVLVLVPGGTFSMGAQASDPAGENHDPRARPDESPVRALELAPFFLSKYEMTQGQWERCAGLNPSYHSKEIYLPEWNADGRPWSALLPVEHVSWNACRTLLERIGLTLPSEAQWEYAARAGTSSVWWSGDETESLQSIANLADGYARRHGAGSWESDALALDDGNTVPAVVGLYEPNSFGLHDVHGNVWEWCLDVYGPYREDEAADPVPADPAAFPDRSLRGGSFNVGAFYARSAMREFDKADYRKEFLGLRPARRILPRAAPRRRRGSRAPRELSRRTASPRAAGACSRRP